MSTPPLPEIAAVMSVDEALDVERRLNARVELLARKRKPTDGDVAEATAWDVLMRHIGDGLDEAAADAQHPLEPDHLREARFGIVADYPRIRRAQNAARIAGMRRRADEA